MTLSTPRTNTPPVASSLKPAIRQALTQRGARGIRFDGHSTHGQREWRVTFESEISDPCLVMRWVNQTLAPLSLKAAYVLEARPPFPVFIVRIVRRTD